MERIRKTLDALQVKYDWEAEDGKEEKDAIIEFWTDTADQDVPTEFYFDGTAEDFAEKFTEAAESYDVDEEAELFISIRGEHGIPTSVTTIVKSCQEAKDTLMKISDALNKAVGAV